MTAKRSYRRPALRSRAGRALDALRAARLRALAEAQLEARSPGSAVSAAGGAVVLDPGSDRARLLLASALYRSGDFDSAVAWLARPAQCGDAGLRAGAERLRGRIELDRRQPEAALAALSMALLAEQESAETRVLRAQAHLACGEPGEAIADLDAALSIECAHVEARTLRAAALLEAGRIQQALADLDGISAGDRQVEHALLELRARLLAGHDPRALDDVFERAIARFGRDRRLRLAFARHLASRSAEDAAAAERARALLAELAGEESADDADAAEALFLLAELCRADGERAEAYYRRGLLRAPDHPRGLCGLARLLGERGRQAQAVPLLLRALMAAPSRQETVEQLARTLGAIPDDESLARWLGLLLSGLPGQAPGIVCALLRAFGEAGRTDAFEDVRREAHRMKNRVAVESSRCRAEGDAQRAERLDALFADWARFLDAIRRCPPAPALCAPLQIVRAAVAQVAFPPGRLRLLLGSGAGALPLVLVDAGQIIDALVNLLVNADQASPEDRPLRLALRCGSDPGWVEIAVTDEGAGLDRAEQVRIFEPGYTAGKEGGSGLGLSIARRAVLSCGGRLTVASARGGPTTFVVRLPAVDAPGPRPLVLLSRLPGRAGR
ncbi:MAG: hypothetical protein JXR96_14555 [Deltaproteobacteria bacterium]|nr:hypothetical protein [Deltaproteobacteria bacterium]